jgi:hypothetical protein
MNYLNYFAVLASAVAAMIIGAIWYGPLFGKKFTAALGLDKLSPEKQAEMKKLMPVSYLGQFLASLVMFYVMSALIGGLGELTVWGGLMTALLVWVGFVVPLKLGDLLWGGKMTMFWLGVGNMLLTLLAAGAIIGAWR